MQVSAIILAGGSSSRFGEDKALVSLAGKPLIKYVLDIAKRITEEQLIVVSSSDKLKDFKKILGSETNVMTDNFSYNIHAPLIGAITGFKNVKGEYSLLLPCDTPFISREILDLIIELRGNRSAVIPRWPNGYIEPLQAIYHTGIALETAETVLELKKFDMFSFVGKLRRVRYISTLVLQQLDPKLKTFFNINTPLDLKKAEFLIKHKKTIIS